VKKKKREETEIVVQAPYKRPEYEIETKRPKISKVKRFWKAMPHLMYDSFFGCVLYYFKKINRKVWPELPLWPMKCETLEHVDALIKVFKRIVLPASIVYICAKFYFFRENALDSMFLGMLIFFYSNFLPDLPSIFRRKIRSDVRNANEDLPWYKKYALLLLAPLFIGIFLCGIQFRWKTIETFHNLRALTVYGAFLFMLSLFAFGDFPISIGDLTEIISLPLYGLIGYLTHLKVDQYF
jgi:hypothetical protein